MDINKKNRTDLKLYFVKNAIPTESNFADLIDAMLNQKEDGIAKPAGNPLSIEATGDATSLRKAINFYENFGDLNPAWAVSLNPRVTPGDPTTAKPGFAISDPTGVNRLFIDKTTGNVGIGTIVPQAVLHVEGSELFCGGAVAGFSFANRNAPNNGARVDAPPAGQRWVWYASDKIARLWTNTNGDRLVVDADGKVGIGVPSPAFKLEVSDQIRLRSGGVGSNAGLWLTGPSGNDRAFMGLVSEDQVGFWGGGGRSWGILMDVNNGNVGIGTGTVSPGRALEVSAVDSNTGIKITGTDSQRSWLVGVGVAAGDGKLSFYDYGAAAHRLTIDTNGNVGIGVPSPNLKFEVSDRIRLHSGGVGSTAGLWLTGPSGNDRAFVGLASETQVGFWEGGANTWGLLMDVNNGNVGIGTGTVSPGRALEVSAVDSNTGIKITGTDSQRSWLVGVGVAVGDGKLSFYDYGAAAHRLTIDTNGNVGIGTTSHTAKLYVNNLDNSVGTVLATNYEGPAELRVRSYTTQPANVPSFGIVHAFYDDEHNGFINFWRGAGMNGGFLTFGTSGSERLRIDANGNVGIGAAIPRRTLHVEGLEVHSGGAGAGFSFANRNAPNNGGLNDTGTAGQRWIWYSQDSIARLWTNFAGDRIQVDSVGNLGTHGFPAQPKTKGWAGGIHTWDVEAEGTIWSQSGYQSAPRDVAENFVAGEPLECGDVVALDADIDQVLLSRSANDSSVIGIVSTKPGFLLHSRPEASEEHKHVPIALCGRVPCKVCDENGPISRGDLLVSSSMPGHAMKANSIKVGGKQYYALENVVGKALGKLQSGIGVIDVFVL